LKVSKSLGGASVKSSMKILNVKLTKEKMSNIKISSLTKEILTKKRCSNGLKDLDLPLKILKMSRLNTPVLKDSLLMIAKRNMGIRYI
jgi:hypothetical protein